MPSAAVLAPLQRKPIVLFERRSRRRYRDDLPTDS
jgi:hypothetical protein